MKNRGKINDVFDKMIHRDEFKLRLLLTNSCNKNCVFCLNDFQNKPEKGHPGYFLDSGLALIAITAYHNVAVKLGYRAQVYFSGGEPTLHRDFEYLVRAAKRAGCRVTVNTNGTFEPHLLNVLREVDCLHFGVYEKSTDMAEKISCLNGSVQCVYSSKDPYVDYDFVRFYLQYGIPVKVFGDLRENPALYEAFANSLRAKFPSDKDLSFRFIGKQENRGVGCSGCCKNCVTLKAAWVFPDGTITHCPQKPETMLGERPHIWAWVDQMNRIEQLHRTECNRGS